MNAYDHLLYWISSRGRATHQRASETCEWLRDQYGLDERLSHLTEADRAKRVRHRLLGSLNQLGHGERSLKGWEVAPPLLLIVKETPARREAILSGARQPSWKEEMLGQSGLRFLCEEQGAGPEVWRVQETEYGVIDSVASRLGLGVGNDRSLDFLRSAPTFRDAIRAGEETRFSPELSRYSCAQVKGKVRSKWVDARADAPGLYRNRTNSYGPWFFQDETNLYSVPRGDVRFIARWVSASAQVKIRIRFDRGRLWVPHIGVPLPTLLTRSLTMSSGLLPTFEEFGWCYKKLTASHAAELSRILGIELEAK